MSRARAMTYILRFVVLFLALVIAILVFGPFQGAEAKVGMTDKQGHALAFYALTGMMLLAFPRLRKLDIAVICLGLGGLIEVIQPFVGRDGDINDWLADGIGVGLAIIPIYFQAFRATIRDGFSGQKRRRRGDFPKRPVHGVETRGHSAAQSASNRVQMVAFHD